MIGTVLAGKYRIEAQLFVDKLGTAYRGRTVSGGTSLLVLVLDVSIQPTKEQLDHILAVSKQIRDLNHPALVPTIDWIRVDGQVALISPRNDAIPFEEFCKGGIGLAETVDLTSQIGEAVQVARDAGVTHKDLSSHSILVSIPAEGGQLPRIFFWGYDILLPPYSVGKKDDKFWGTPEFMAPELCSGKGWNPQSDVYSLGILLFQLVTGKPPFISTNYNTTMKRQIYEKPLPLNLLKRGIPHIAEFEKIVFEALQKMVAKRPESTRALAGLLVDFRRSYLPEAAATPLQVVNWPAISFSGEEGSAAAAVAEPAGTLTFRGLGDAAEKAAAETRIEGATTGATLQFQAAPVEESTAKFEPAAVAPAPQVDPQTQTAVMEIPIAAPVPKPEPEAPKGKKDKKADKAAAAAAPAAAKVDKAAAAPASGKIDPADKAAISESARKRIEEETRQLEETGDDWFVDGADTPKVVAEMPLPGEERKSAPSAKEWRLWALIAVVSLAIVAVLIWLLSPGAPDDAAKKAQAPAAPKTQSLTKVPMSDTPAADAKQKTPDAKQPDAAEAAKKAKADQEAAAAAEAAKKAAELEAAKKAAAEEEAKKAAKAEADRLAAEAAAKKAAEEAEAAKKAAEEAAKAAVGGDEAARKAAEAAAKAAADEAAKKAQEAAAAQAAKQAQEEAALRAAQNAEAAKLAQEAAAKKAAEEAAKKAEADAAAKKAAEEAAKKAADEAAKKAAADAAAKKAAEEAAKKKAADEAAKKGGDDAAKKAAEEAAKKKAADEAAKKAAADAAAKKAAEEAAKKKAAEDAAKKEETKKEETAGGDAAEQAKKFKGMGIKALKKGNCPLAIRYFETAKKYAPEDTTIDKFIEKCKEGGGE